MKKIITLLLVVWATTATAATIAVPRTILFDGNFTRDALKDAVLVGRPILGEVPDEYQPVWTEYVSLPLLPALGANEPAVEFVICTFQGEEFYAFIQHTRTWWGKLKLYRLVIYKGGLWQEADKETLQYMGKKGGLLPPDSPIDYN